MSKGNGDKGNEDKSNGGEKFPRGKGDYHGKHRAEDRPSSGPLGHRTERPHADDGWFPERG